jgi:heme oxygenase
VSLPQRLKRETRHEHVRLEERLDLPRERFDLSELVHLLGRFYGFYWPCEEELEGLPGELRQQLLPRRKTLLLARDLQRLGMTSQAIATLPHCHLSSTGGRGETLGRWYVLEGSTLGGQLINRWLTTTLDLEGGSLFFVSYGDQVGPMWREYCQWLDELDPSEHDQVVASARQTFEALEEWLCGPG